MRKKGLACILTVMMTLSLAACGSKTNNNGSTDQSETTTNFSVGMVTDTGGINDQSFNQSAWEGLQKVRDQYGINASYLESVQEADYTTNLDKLLDENNDFIWGVGFAMANALDTAAATNMDQAYGILDHSYGDAVRDNVTCVMFRSEEASFLVGYAAGLTTKTDKVGFVGGIASDVVKQFEYGYRAGVEYAAKELGKDIEVVVQYAESFTDAAKGKAIATKMYSDGCDIVFHAAGNVGNGVIEAAKDSGKFVIGVDRDQYDLAPNNILTSALKRVDSAVVLVTEEVMNGNDLGGQTLEYGLAEESVGIPTENPNMDPKVYKATMEVQQQIIDGKIEVPYNAETFEAFVAQ